MFSQHSISSSQQTFLVPVPDTPILTLLSYLSFQHHANIRIISTLEPDWRLMMLRQIEEHRILWRLTWCGGNTKLGWVLTYHIILVKPRWEWKIVFLTYIWCLIPPPLPSHHLQLLLLVSDTWILPFTTRNFVEKGWVNILNLVLFMKVPLDWMAVVTIKSYSYSHLIWLQFNIIQA